MQPRSHLVAKRAATGPGKYQPLAPWAFQQGRTRAGMVSSYLRVRVVGFLRSGWGALEHFDEASWTELRSHLLKTQGRNDPLKRVARRWSLPIPKGVRDGTVRKAFDPTWREAIGSRRVKPESQRFRLMVGVHLLYEDMARLAGRLR